MQIPLQIVFEHVDHSDLIESHAREAAGKLEQFYDRITSARVVIGKPQHRHNKGDTYSVRLHLTIPGAADIAVSRDPAATGRHEDVEVTLHDAFDAARRELQDFVRRRQGHAKSHETPPHGTIAALHRGRDHGFIASADGREIYFHRNSVEADKFDDLKVGQEVRFARRLATRGRKRPAFAPSTSTTWIEQLSAKRGLPYFNARRGNEPKHVTCAGSVATSPFRRPLGRLPRQRCLFMAQSVSAASNRTLPLIRVRLTGRDEHCDGVDRPAPESAPRVKNIGGPRMARRRHCALLRLGGWRGRRASGPGRSPRSRHPWPRCSTRAAFCSSLKLA